MTETYRIADRNIRITSLYEEVHVMCGEYQTDDSPEIRVRICQEDIDYERNKSRAEDLKEGIPVREFPDSYLETLAVYRKIADSMADEDTLLFHGSVIAVDGEGYLFTAKSGTGKSTHTRLWRERFGERVVMVNDDKPLLKITDKGVIAYGTPWDGKHRLSSNIAVPLKGICILTRAEKNSITSITKTEAYPMLLQQTHRPQETAQLAKVLIILDRLAANVPLYRLGCNMDPEAADIAYQGMKGVSHETKI